MPRVLAIAAALATALALAGCGSAQSAEQAHEQQAQGQSESHASGSSASQSDASQAGASRSDAGESGGADGALRSDALSGAVALDAGEPGLPRSSGASVDDVLRLGAVASWLDAPDTLAISLPASTDCWPSATAPVVESASQLSLEFVAGECAAFDSARTYTVEVPEGIDAGAPLEVQIEGLQHAFTLTLPAA